MARKGLFLRIVFNATSSALPAGEVVKVYNGQGDVENQIKEGNDTCDGTRRAAIASPPIMLGCLWESWRTPSCTCSGNSVSWARRANGQWSGSLGV